MTGALETKIALMEGWAMVLNEIKIKSKNKSESNRLKQFIEKCKIKSADHHSIVTKKLIK